MHLQSLVYRLGPGFVASLYPRLEQARVLFQELVLCRSGVESIARNRKIRSKGAIDYLQDVVALTEEINAIHKETSGPILLRPGQVGTILMSFDDRAYLVDFADAQGNTYAMETVPSEKLMQLVYEPLPAYA